MQRHTFLRMALPALAATLFKPAMAQPDAFRIGLTPVILADQAAFLARWSEYLSKRIGSPVAFIARESYQNVLDLLFGGQLEAAWVCGYPYVRHLRRLQLLAVPHYEGRPLYQAYLIRTGRESTVQGWRDVKDKVLAYSDPLSNSGWLVAQTQLHAAGLSPRDLKKSFFAHGHRTVAEAVAARLAHAGSIDGYVWETMRQQGMAAVEQTEVVWKSEPFGFPPIVARRNSRHGKTVALQAILLGMQNEPEGLALLKALNLTGFEAGSPSLFSSIAKMAASTEARVT